MIIHNQNPFYIEMLIANEGRELNPPPRVFSPPLRRGGARADQARLDRSRPTPTATRNDLELDTLSAHERTVWPGYIERLAMSVDPLAAAIEGNVAEPLRIVEPAHSASRHRSPLALFRRTHKMTVAEFSCSWRNCLVRIGQNARVVLP